MKQPPQSHINRNKILSIKNLEVNFRVRSRILKAIRNVSFDLYDGEILALVGESGSGKSVITKTFTGMLESNGWISNGSITYYPNQGSNTPDQGVFKQPIDLAHVQKQLIDRDTNHFIKHYCVKKLKRLNTEKKSLTSIMSAPANQQNIEKIQFRTNAKIAQTQAKLAAAQTQAIEFKKLKKPSKIVDLEKKLTRLTATQQLIGNNQAINAKIALIDTQMTKLNADLARFANNNIIQNHHLRKIISEIEQHINNQTFPDNQTVTLVQNSIDKMKYLTDFENEIIHFWTQLVNHQAINVDDFANLVFDWKHVAKKIIGKNRYYKKMMGQVRGKTIATIFQDPMTSLNPLLSVGFQISEILVKKRKMSRAEAKIEAVHLLEQVGITNAQERYKDIPGRYSGGMRQRVVIAIALACRPQILICDEPTTALDVTIQAQILRLIKKLQSEYKFSTIFITHDLGVVANIADRVAVMYAGQIVEIGTTQEIFKEAKHPYTWALLLSLPQLGTKGEDLYSIGGTPPSLFHEIKGDAFAPRNKYAMAIDYVHEPPMFKISETHYAKTWLLHDQAPSIADEDTTKPAPILSKKENNQ